MSMPTDRSFQKLLVGNLPVSNLPLSGTTGGKPASSQITTPGLWEKTCITFRVADLRACPSPPVFTTDTKPIALSHVKLLLCQPLFWIFRRKSLTVHRGDGDAIVCFFPN